MVGPRIYNLFPLLCGPVANWRRLLPRVAAMGFDWVYVNPFHYPGFSGSLYAVKDYYALNPLFEGEDDAPADELIRSFVEDARAHGLAVMMDLVINHTAKDSVLVEQHPTWFAREADGAIRSPRAIDPADATKVTVWGDLAEIDYGNVGVRDAILDYWKQLLRHCLDLGFSGFRCDAAYNVPATLWAPLIAEQRSAGEACFFAETLGCRIEQVEALTEAGFDFLFNSVKWWDMRAAWAPEQYERFRHIAPSVGFPESHDTERLAADLPEELREPAAARRFYLLRYALAACFATGVLMPIGYEHGFRRRLDVVRTRPADREEPWFDLSDDIAAINRVKASCPALNEEGPMRHQADGGVALLRQTEDASAGAIFMANPSRSGPVRIDLAPLLRGTNIGAESLRNVTPGATEGVGGLTFELNPLEWRLLQTT